MSCTDPVDLQPALLDDQLMLVSNACESAAALQPSCQVARMERTCGLAIYAATGNPRLPSHCFYVVAHSLRLDYSTLKKGNSRQRPYSC